MCVCLSCLTQFWSAGFLRKIGQQDILYKPVQAGVKGQTEVWFYETLFGSEDLPEEVVRLKGLVPRYYGKETIWDRAGHFRILIIYTCIYE